MKYFVDMQDRFWDLVRIEDREIIYTGTYKEVGIKEDDDQYTNKLDVFIEKKFGITPDEWEIG